MGGYFFGGGLLWIAKGEISQERGRMRNAFCGYVGNVVAPE